jgi:hypothetical protein
MGSQPSLRESTQNGTMIMGLWLGKMFKSHLSIGVASQMRKKKELWKAMEDKYIFPI